MHTLAEDRSLRKYSHLISPHLILPKIISGVCLQHLETSIATAFKSYLQESFKGLGPKSQKLGLLRWAGGFPVRLFLQTQSSQRMFPGKP